MLKSPAVPANLRGGGSKPGGDTVSENLILAPLTAAESIAWQASPPAMRLAAATLPGPPLGNPGERVAG